MNLVVKSRYLELIRSGRKTSTIRAWPTAKIRRGDRLSFTDYRSSARAHCTACEPCTLDALTNADAHADGFVDADELRRALRTHYPALAANARVWIVRFELLKDSDHSALAFD